MKTLDIVLIGSGVALLGYLAYKNKDQFTKPLTDSDNQPLRADFDTGTNNGNGYQTEEEKPAADPVVLSKPKLFIAEVPVKNAEVISDGGVFHTGEQPSAIDKLLEKPIAQYETPDPSPATAIEKLLNKPLPIPERNTTTPFAEERPTLKPLVAQVTPSAPVVSIADTPEQYPTLLYNNSPRNISPEQYDYGMGERDKLSVESNMMYAQDF